MPRDNRRPRKRPRRAAHHATQSDTPVPRQTSTARTSRQANAASASRLTSTHARPASDTGTGARADAPRAIPGFFWDPEKRRYFPVVSRAATGREQQHQERQRRHVERIAETQKLSQPTRQSVPLLLRQRSECLPQSPQSRRAAAGRLSFAFMNKDSHPIFHAPANSPVTALKIFADASGQRYMAAGHRSGSVVVSELSDDDETGRSITNTSTGEITAICHLGDDVILHTSMGSGLRGGTLSYSKLTGRPLAGREFSVSLFSACPPPAQQHRTALGVTRGIRVVDLFDPSLEIFKMRCKSDILCTVFADAHVGFGGGRDGQIRLFDARVDGAGHHPRRGLFADAGCRHSLSVHGLGVDGWQLASASMDGQVHVWDIRMPGHGRHYNYVCASRPSNASKSPSVTRLGFTVARGVIAAANPENQIRLWELHTGQLLQTVLLAPDADPCLALDLKYTISGRPQMYIGQSNAVCAYNYYT